MIRSTARVAVALAVLASALGAQTPKAAPCDSAAVLLTAKPIYGVGTATYANACPGFAAAIDAWFVKDADAITKWTPAQVVAFISHGVRPTVIASPPAVVDPAPIVPQSGAYPNRPASFTKSTQIDFSQAVPSLPDDRDRPIAGSDWAMIYFGSNWTSKDGVWSGRWAPGSYGGGVIGQGNGHGIGNVFVRPPGGTSRLYLSMRVYFDFDAAQWHPISNKFVNLEGDHSQILMQLREANAWRHAEELGFGGAYTSFFVDGGRNAPGEAHVAGQVDNRAVPNRQWTQIEILIDLPNRIYKIWQDGVLTTNASPTFASTKIITAGFYAFRGGGGETLSTELTYKYDHFFIAW